MSRHKFKRMKRRQRVTASPDLFRQFMGFAFGALAEEAAKLPEDAIVNLGNTGIMVQAKTLRATLDFFVSPVPRKRRRRNILLIEHKKEEKNGKS